MTPVQWDKVREMFRDKACSSFNQYNKLNKLHFVNAGSLINQIQERLQLTLPAHWSKRLYLSLYKPGNVRKVTGLPRSCKRAA